MSNRLDDKVVLITGGGAGIGEATARSMVAQGARVAVVDVNAEAANRVAMSLNGSDEPVLALQADVASEQDIASAVTDCISHFSTLDIVIANAGVQLHQSDRELHRLPAEVWDETHAVNYRGVFFTVKHALAHMAERGSGVVGIVSSITGLNGMSPNVSYASGKAGLLNLNRHIAVHYARHGIRSFAVSPGALEQTPNWDAHPDPQLRFESLTARIPMGRLGTVRDIASVITFLAGSGAGYVNGANVVVDGGLTVV